MALGSGWMAVLAIATTLGVGSVATPMLMGWGGPDSDSGSMCDGARGMGMMGGGMHGGPGGMCGDHDPMGEGPDGPMSGHGHEGMMHEHHCHGDHGEAESDA